MSMAKIAVPMVNPMDLSRLTADVVIPISDGLELFWTAAMTTAIMQPRPRPRTKIPPRSFAISNPMVPTIVLSKHDASMAIARPAMIMLRVPRSMFLYVTCSTAIGFSRELNGRAHT